MVRLQCQLPAIPGRIRPADLPAGVTTRLHRSPICRILNNGQMSSPVRWLESGDSMPVGTALTPGKVLAGRYKLISLLGQGGAGAVYLAEISSFSIASWPSRS